MLNGLDLAVEKDVAAGAYDPYIKDHCVFCGAKIPGNLSYYALRGNCCSTCNTRFEEYVGPKYTPEEKSAMRATRIREVREYGFDKKLVGAMTRYSE